ncbi:MAG: alpha-amylase family glycosyl hydrolase [Gemmatimonadaceae bacterium]
MHRIRSGLVLGALCAAVSCAHPRRPGSEPPPAVRHTAQWWRDAVCYEVFVRSFSDANGDGIGDLQGLTARLDYINDGNASTTGDLGANCIWLMPIAKSPSYHGYDVTDYYHVNPDYGTDDDFRHLMGEAHRRGIRVLVDFVPNHSSIQHPFFQAALRDPASPYRAWYRWSATKPDQKGPWGQEVWHRSPVRDEYYYGIFWGGMPDLNYETPVVRREMERAGVHWVTEMGADGLRMDAVPHLVEAGSLMQHAIGTHAVLREFAAAMRRAAPNAFTIGEAWTDSVPLLSRYYPDQLDAYFGFPVADATIDAASRGDARHFLDVLGRTNGLLPAGRWAPFLTNHDTPRVMTKLRGNVAQARVAAMAMMTLPGTPFIYYGEELGMRGDKPDEQIRTPMQWSSVPGGGFTQGKPWEAPQPDWQTVNVAAQESDTSSLLHLYRRLIRLRLDEPALRHGDLTLARSSNGAVAAYLRRTGDATSVVVVNFGAEAVDRVAVDFTVPSCGERKPSIGRLFGDATAGVEYSPAGVTVTNLAARQGYVYALRCG